MEKNKQNILLMMHDFYAQEARHQRTMMWETVKWFTPILTLIAAGWVKLFIDEFCPLYKHNIGYLLTALSILGILLSYISMQLLNSFYKTNLKYITMFAKVQEELDFDSRTEPVKFYPGDDLITWQGYIDHRSGKETKKISRNNGKQWTSKMLVEDQMSVKWYDFKRASIYNRMQWVFLSFILAFISAFLFVIKLMFP